MDNRSFQEILASQLAEKTTATPERQKSDDGGGIPLFSSDFLSIDLDPFKIASGVPHTAQNTAQRLGRTAYNAARSKVRPMPIEPEEPIAAAIAVKDLSVAARLALQTLNDGAKINPKADLKIDTTKITLKDVRRMFYRLARSHHPDVATETQKEIQSGATIETYLLYQDAYDVLCAEFNELKSAA